MTTTTGEYSVDCCDAIGGRLDLDIVDGFKETGCCLSRELVERKRVVLGSPGGKMNSKLVERWG